MYSPIQTGYASQDVYSNRTCGTPSPYGGASNGIVAGGCTQTQTCSPCCEPHSQPTYAQPSYGTGDIAQVMMKVIGEIGHKMMAPMYQMAKSNPMMYGAGVAGLSVGSGMMACPYWGMMMAGLGAMGYMQAQQQPPLF